MNTINRTRMAYEAYRNGEDPDKLDTPQCWVNRCSVRTGLLLCILGDVAVFYLAVKLF